MVQEPKDMQKWTQQQVVYLLLMLALSFVLGLASLYVPVLSVVTVFLFPIPLAMVTFRDGLGWGIVGIMVVTLLLSLCFDPFTAGILSMQYGILGLFFGACFRQKRRPGRVLLIGVLLAAGLSVLALFLTAVASGITLSQMYDSYVTVVKQTLDQAFNQVGYQQIAGLSVEEYEQTLMTAFQQMLPALLIIGAMIQASIGYLITVKLARRIDASVLKLPPFDQWRLSWQLVWVFIIAIIFNGLSQIGGWTLVQQITANIMYVFYPLLFICGLSFIFWLMQQFNSGGRVITVVLAIFFFNIFIWFLMIVAVADPIFDLRKRLGNLFHKDQS